MRELVYDGDEKLMIAVDIVFKGPHMYYAYNFERLPDSLKFNYEIQVDRTLKKRFVIEG